jgi:hypothetical protein
MMTPISSHVHRLTTLNASELHDSPQAPFGQLVFRLTMTELSVFFRAIFGARDIYLPAYKMVEALGIYIHS